MKINCTKIILYLKKLKVFVKDFSNLFESFDLFFFVFSGLLLVIGN